MHLTKEGKVWIGFITLILCVYITVVFVRGSHAASRTDEVKFKIFHLLNLELLEREPTPTFAPGQATPTPVQQTELVTKIYHIEADSQKREIGTGRFSLSNGYSLMASFDIGRPLSQGKKYVVWLKHAASYVQIGEFTLPVITITDYKNSEDLTDYDELVVTEEATDFNDPVPSSGNDPVYQAQQEDATPTSAPPPTQSQNPTTSQPTQGQSNPALDEKIQSVINAVSQSNIQKHLEEITENGTQTRFSGTDGNVAEAQYIKQHFENLGLEVEYDTQEFSYTYRDKPITTKNIVGRLYGKDRNTFYLLTAHMDSTAERSGSTDPAPGANDNGSGTSSILEIARALKESNIEFEHSIEFILFSGEEQGLIGSQKYVGKLARSKRIAAVINLDMVGNKTRLGECVKFRYKPGTGGNIITDPLVAVNQQFNVGLNTESIPDSNGASDHASFWYAGIHPAVFGHECGHILENEVYHKITDTIPNLDVPQITKTAKIVAGGLVKLIQNGIGMQIAQNYNDQLLSQNNTGHWSSVYSLFPNFANSFDARLAQSNVQNPPSNSYRTLVGQAQAESKGTIFAVVTYNDLPDLDILFKYASTPIDYLQGESLPEPIFLGLFTESQIAAIEQNGFPVKIIDRDVDLRRYVFLYHPKPNQGNLLKDRGEVFEVAPNYLLLKMNPGEVHTHEGVGGEFFDLPLPQNIAKPPFKTVTITIAPAQTEDVVSQPDEVKRSNHTPVIVFLSLIIAAIFAAVVFYFIKRYRF